jgi:Domain of unknown function (DUF4124)
MALALLLTVGQAHAQMYKWVDSSGVTHYGDLPPNGTKAASTKLRAGNSGTPIEKTPSRSGAGSVRDDTETTFKQRQSARDDADSRQRQLAVAHCEELRAKLARQMSIDRDLSLVNKDGSMASQADIEASNTRLHNDIAARCGRP